MGKQKSWSVLSSNVRTIENKHAVEKCNIRERGTHCTGGTSRMQWPKVPKMTDEWRMSVWFVSITFRMAMSLMTGAEMVVMRRRMEAMKRNATPTLSNLMC